MELAFLLCYTRSLMNEGGNQMPFFQKLKSYPDFVSGQTVQTRAEVEEIRSQLLHIGNQISQNAIDEKQIFKGLKNAQKAQISFRERVESVSKSLSAYKTRLASFHS